MSLEDRAGAAVFAPSLVDQPGHLLWRAAAGVTARLTVALPLGVDIHGYAALQALADGVPRTQRSLADTIDVSRTTMAKVAAALVREGLVERIRNPDDRRSYLLTRTAHGASVAERWARDTVHLEGALTVGLEDEDRAELRRLLLVVLDGELRPDTPPALLSSAAFLVTRAHQRVHRTFVEQLAPLGILPPHYGLMQTLRDLGPVPQAELSRRLGVSAPSVVQLVDDLEDRGLVERRRLEFDRRNQVVHLREEAGAVVDQACELARSTLRERLGGMRPEEAETLVRLLRKLVTGG